MQYQTISVDLQDGVLSVYLNRPEKKNSFNSILIQELKDVFTRKDFLSSSRLAVLQGKGEVFCGGGDLTWMKEGLSLSEEENLADCKELTAMFCALDRYPHPLLGVVESYAIGGGVGLVSVCDHVIAEESTLFSLSEVRLGLIPACIAPFVVKKIGLSQARSLFISGIRFGAEKAKAMGLLHEVCTQEELYEKRDAFIKSVKSAGKRAVEQAKALLHNLADHPDRSQEETLSYVAQELAHLRIGEEAQEGIRAFLEKRKPHWIDK